MRTSVNKSIFKKYIEALNNKNWDVLEEILHDEFCDETSVNPENAEFAVNPFVEFLHLMDVDTEVVKGLENHLAGYDKETKSNVIKLEKLAINILDNYKILDMIAEENRVWASLAVKIVDLNNLDIWLNLTQYIWFKDEKIIRRRSFGRFFNSLIQFGRIIIQRNQEDEIISYLERLESLGVIPHKKNKI